MIRYLISRKDNRKKSDIGIKKVSQNINGISKLITQLYINKMKKAKRLHYCITIYTNMYLLEYTCVV